MNKIFNRNDTKTNNKHNLEDLNSINYEKYIDYMRKLKKNKFPNKLDNYNHLITSNSM